jgi:hypothetical protein
MGKASGEEPLAEHEKAGNDPYAHELAGEQDEHWDYLDMDEGGEEGAAANQVQTKVPGSNPKTAEAFREQDLPAGIVEEKSPHKEEPHEAAEEQEAEEADEELGATQIEEAIREAFERPQGWTGQQWEKKVREFAERAREPQGKDEEDPEEPAAKSEAATGRAGKCRA